MAEDKATLQELYDHLQVTEEPVVNTGVEPVVETPEQNVVQPQQPETNTATPQVEEKRNEINILESFNSLTGRQFKDEAEVKKFFEGYGGLEKELNDRKSRDPYWQELETSFKSIVDQFDPKKQFGSEENWKRFEMSQQIGKGKNQYVVNEIVNKDVLQIDELKIAAMHRIFNAPKLSEEEGKRSVLKAIGVEITPDTDINNPELTPEQRVELSIMASEARDRFDSLKSSVKYPEFPDHTKIIEENAQKRLSLKQDNDNKWGEFAKGIAKEPPKYQKLVKDKDGKTVVDFEFSFDKEFLNEAVELIHKDAVLRGIEVSEENKKQQTDLLQMYSVYKNIDKIVDAAVEEKLAAQAKVLDDKVHNNQPINRTEAPPTGEKTEEELANEQMGEFLRARGLIK